MTKSLADKYNINTRYQRSARIDTDWKNDVVSGYVLHGTARRVIKRIAEQISDSKKPQKSFTITGPYGGGKSSLALIIANLVSLDTETQKQTLKIFTDKEEQRLLKNAFSSSKGWVTIRVVGSRTNPIESIYAAAVQAIKTRFKKIPKSLDIEKRPNHKNLMNLLDNLNAELSKTNDGIMLIIDEMGKFLEYAAYENGDIFIFQELAEKFNRSKNPNLFMGILHQAIGEYAKSLNKLAQEEWGKIQGRFLDLPFSVGIDEVLSLVGQAIEGPSANTQQKNTCQQVAKAVKNASLGTTENLSSKLYECIPLHPVTALMLGPISRRRFGQNERSIFSFLTSGEPNSLNHFLRNELSTSKNIFTLDLLWDYLKINLEPLILSSPDGHLWSEATEALIRAEKKGNNNHLKIVKAVAIIEIFGKQFGIRPSKEILESLLDDNTNIKSILKDLESWTIVVYRKYLNAWGLHAGSDINLEELLQISSSQVQNTNDLIIQNIPFQNPVIAKQHYHTTGTLRWFEIYFVFTNDLQYFISTKSSKINAGQMIIVLKKKEEAREDVHDAIRSVTNLTKQLDHPVLFGFPENDQQLIQEAQELSALEKIKATNQKLTGDAVARKELNARINNAKIVINQTIKTLLDVTTWVFTEKTFPKTSSLSNLASTVCDDVFSKTPVIKNELINRDKVSGVAVAASKELLENMFKRPNELYFGIDKFPPSKSMYLSLFRNTKIHQIENHDYVIKKPQDPNDTIAQIWEEMINFLKDNKHRRVSFNELFLKWSKPPYGIRQGIIPILALTIYEAHREELALFVDDLFVPDIDDYGISRLFKDANSIAVRYVELAAFGKETLRKVSDIFADRTHNQKESVLDVAKRIVQYVLDLKPLVKRTDRISPQAIKFRNSVLNGKDPYDLLFQDLPQAYGMTVGKQLGDLDKKDAERLPTLIKDSLDELKSVEIRFDQELKEAVYSALGYNLTDNINTTKLSERAQRVQGISGDFSLEAFIRALIDSKDNKNWITNLASLAAEKPVANWFDLDFDRAKYEMYSLVSRFKRVENHVLDNSTGKGIFSLSTVTTLNEGNPKEVNLSAQLEEDQIKKVENISKEIELLLEKAKADDQIKLGVMSTLLDELKTKEELIKRKKKLN